MPLDHAAAGARHRGAARRCRSGSRATTRRPGVVRLADVKMALAVRSITTERGLDPRDYTLVAYGGGGPLHAVAIARELGHPAGHHPAGALDVLGVGHARHRPPARPGAHRARAARADRRARGRRRGTARWSARSRPSCRRSARRPVIARRDLRYLGQEHTVTVEVGSLADWASLRGRFDAAHQRAYGYAAPDVEVQLLNLRLAVVYPLERPPLADARARDRAGARLRDAQDLLHAAPRRPRVPRVPARSAAGRRRRRGSGRDRGGGHDHDARAGRPPPGRGQRAAS